VSTLLIALTTPLSVWQWWTTGKPSDQTGGPTLSQTFRMSRQS
jgi:hypothetical protein